MQTFLDSIIHLNSFIQFKFRFGLKIVRLLYQCCHVYLSNFKRICTLQSIKKSFTKGQVPLTGAGQKDLPRTPHCISSVGYGMRYRLQYQNANNIFETLQGRQGCGAGAARFLIMIKLITKSWTRIQIPNWTKFQDPDPNFMYLDPHQGFK